MIAKVRVIKGSGKRDASKGIVNLMDKDNHDVMDNLDYLIRFEKTKNF